MTKQLSFDENQDYLNIRSIVGEIMTQATGFIALLQFTHSINKIPGSCLRKRNRCRSCIKKLKWTRTTCGTKIRNSIEL